MARCPGGGGLYHVGQVDHDLIIRSRKGGTDGTVAGDLMLAEVRRACGARWRRPPTPPVPASSPVPPA